MSPIMKVLKERGLINKENLVLNRHKGDEYIAKLLRADARNYSNAPAFIERNKYFFETPDKEALQPRPSLYIHGIPKSVANPVPIEALNIVAFCLGNIANEDWIAGNIRKCINDEIISPGKENSLKENVARDGTDPDTTLISLTKAWSGLIHKYIRWAMVAGLSGPDGAESMEILGREETLARLSTATEVLQTSKTHDIEEGSI
jgi:glutamyl-tRNA synthetase